MIVTCDHCGARYRLDESKIPGRGARVTCPSCRHIFVVYRRENTDEASPEAAPEAEPSAVKIRVSVEEEAADLDVNSLDFRSVGIISWKVKVKIGLIYDFNDFKTFNKNLRDGRVTATDLISFDGSEWFPIGDNDALSKRFCEMYVRAKRSKEDDSDDVGEDEPTRIMQAPAEASSQRTLIGPTGEEAVGPAVSVSPSSPESSGNLDSAAALADALADAAAEVDGARADESWKSGRTDSNQPPRFVDPFEKKAQQRSASPRRSSSPPPKRDDAAGNGGMLIAAALIVQGYFGGEMVHGPNHMGIM